MRTFVFAAIVAAVAVVSGFARTDHGPIKWNEDFNAAAKIAKKTGKLMMVDFYADWCGPCKQMLATTYKDKNVVAKSKNFVPVLINTDHNPDLAKKYGIEGIPTVMFMKADGTVIKQKVGYTGAKEFLALMASATSGK